MSIRQVLAAITAYLFASLAFAQGNAIAYPSDYKLQFTNYLSLDRTLNEEQIIRLYANDIALKGSGA